MIKKLKSSARRFEMKDVQWKIFCIVALVFISLFVYFKIHQYDFTVFDDQDYVTDNPHVRTGLAFSNIAWAFGATKNYWHPLTWLSHMLVSSARRPRRPAS